MAAMVAAGCSSISQCPELGMTTSLTEPPAKSGLGTSIIEALTRQLNGRLTISDASPGTTVSMTFPRTS